jgi:hypothetical protein
MKDLPIIIITIALVAAITIAMYIHSRKRMKNTWEGVVEKISKRKKHQNRYGDDLVDIVCFVTVYCRTTNNRIVSFKTEETNYLNRFAGELKQGDKLKKEAGEWLPRKIN